MNSSVRCLHSFPNGDRSKNTKPLAPCRVLSAVLLLCTAEPPFLRMRFVFLPMVFLTRFLASPVPFHLFIVLFSFVLYFSFGITTVLLVGSLRFRLHFTFLPPLNFLGASRRIVVYSVRKYNVHVRCTSATYCGDNVSAASGGRDTSSVGGSGWKRCSGAGDGELSPSLSGNLCTPCYLTVHRVIACRCWPTLARFDNQHTLFSQLKEPAVRNVSLHE